MSTRERKSRPPRWLDNLVERFCASNLLEEVMGDLHERYHRRVEREGERRARSKYWREVLAYMRPSVFKRKTSYHTKPFAATMFKNYFTIAFRNFLRMK